MAKVVLVIAHKNFRDEELFDTRKEIEHDGHQTVVASTSLDEAVGMKGGKAHPKLLLNDIDESDFDAIVFVGGSGASAYFNNQKALALAKEFSEAGKVVAAICIAPSILANAGLLKGRKATAYPSEAKNLSSKGAEFLKEKVVVDNKLVTASGPEAASDFGRKIAGLL